MPQLAGVVVQPEQERAEKRPVDIRPKSGHDAVGGAVGLDLQHGACSGPVPEIAGLCHDAVDPAAGACEPPGGDGRVAGGGGRSHPRRAFGDQVRQQSAAVPKRPLAQVFPIERDQIERDELSRSLAAEPLHA
jgi:hypothetical protein